MSQKPHGHTTTHTNHKETTVTEERRQCTATSKQSGERCKNRPAIGAKTCRFHGSANKRSKDAAARRVEEEAARAAVTTLGLPVDISPSEALLDEVRWTAGHVQWLRAKVQELEAQGQRMVRVDELEDVDDVAQPNAHPLVWGQTKFQNKTGGDDYGRTTVEESAPSVWYVLYERERKHLVSVCTAALKANVEERRVRLAEAQGEQVAGAIRAILNDLGLTTEQQARVSDVVPRHLRLLAGGAA